MLVSGPQPWNKTLYSAARKSGRWEAALHDFAIQSVNSLTW